MRNTLAVGEKPRFEIVHKVKDQRAKQNKIRLQNYRLKNAEQEV
jgi:hypothetical protein